MEKYRIVEITYKNGDKKYICQHKRLLFWWEMLRCYKERYWERVQFNNYYEAIEFIEEAKRAKERERDKRDGAIVKSKRKIIVP